MPNLRFRKRVSLARTLNRYRSIMPRVRDHRNARMRDVTVQSWWGELGELGLRVAGFGGGGYVI